jgi:hypothetical protein
MPTRWPSNRDYVVSVQDLSWCFEDDELRGGIIEPGPTLGVPRCATGQNAIVFPVVCGARTWAVRCFTTPAAEGRQRYEAYSRFIRNRHVPPLVPAEWLERGIQTDDGWWPIVKMEWIEGRTLLEMVRDLRGDADGLMRLATLWRATAAQLRYAKVAHGDFQHGNVLIDRTGAMRLVDYDGIWLPELTDVRSREVGHPNYQHPQRIAEGFRDEYTDTFSALVIYTSLRALASDATLWDLNNGENLIFRQGDYLEPGVTPVWRRLAASGDAEVAELAELVATACRCTVQITTDLEEILTTRHIPEAVGFRSVKTAPKWWHDDYAVQQERFEASAGVVHADWGKQKSSAKPTVPVGANPSGTRAPSPPQLARQRPDWRVIVIVTLLVIALAASLVTIAVATGR